MKNPNLKIASSAGALCALVLVSAPSFVWSQQQPAASSDSNAATTLSSNVKVVDVIATVRDKKGNIVKDLSAGDFKLEQDGKPEIIKYFRKDSDLPLTLGLLIDTSMSQRTAMEQERTASTSFLDTMLREKDQAFLIHFDRQVEMLQDVTSSHQKLQKALGGLQGTQLHQVNDPSSDQDDRRAGGGTTLYDAVFLSADEVMSHQKERKAIIVLSDGVDRGSKVSLDRAIESAQRANVMVYTVYYSGQERQHGFGTRDRNDDGGQQRGGIGFPGGGWPGGGNPGGGRRGGQGRQQQERPKVDGKKILEFLSAQTGGRMFEASKKDSIDKVYAQIEEELRSQYSLGYTPERWSAGYHKLLVTTDKKDLKIQARAGYYAAE